MHNNEFKGHFRRFAKLSEEILPIFFWLGIIFSFDSKEIATLTLITAAIHELGHIAMILALGGELTGIRGAVSGLRIKGVSTSYRKEMMIYAAGPLANIIAALLAIPFIRHEYAKLFIVINLATAISNLLPVEGYDGYGILRVFFSSSALSNLGYSLLSGISLFATSFLLVIALYLIDRLGEGYWIFLIFFFSTLKKLGKGLKNVKNVK